MIKIIKHNSLTKFPLKDNSIDCIITDPPYDLDKEQKKFVHNEMLRVCKGDIIVFSPPENQWRFKNISRYMFWNKSSSTKNYSRSYGRFVEMIFLYKRSAVWNNKLKWSNYTGVYDDRVIGETGHEYEKPESLIERFIRIHTKQNQIILDPFAGSGTVLRVADRLGRKSIGFEITSKWVKYIKDSN